MTVKVYCEVCGGSTGTAPSAVKKHEATAKHAAVLAARYVAPASPSLLPWEPVPGTAHSYYAAEPGDPYDDIAALSRVLRDEKEQAEANLKRRTADYNWRVNNRSISEAEAYHINKVRPLVDRIAQIDDEITGCQTRLKELWDESQAETKAFWANLVQSLSETFSTDEITVTGDGSYGEHTAINVRKAGSTRVSDGLSVALPSSVFEHADDRRAYAFTPSTIGWWSGSQNTADQAEETMALLSTAIRVARAADEIFGF